MSDTNELAQVDEKSSAMKPSIGLSKRRWMSSGIAVVFARGTNEQPKSSSSRGPCPRGSETSEPQNPSLQVMALQVTTAGNPRRAPIPELSEWDTST
jgi:hypothetical protein